MTDTPDIASRLYGPKPAPTAPATAAAPTAPGSKPPDAAEPKPIEEKLFAKTAADAEAKVEADAAAARERVMAGYENFKLPEGFALDEGLAKEILPTLQKHGLPQAEAQRLVEAGTRIAQNTQQQIIREHGEMRKQWVESIKTDPEYGGARFKETVSEAKRAIDGLCVDQKHAAELREALNLSGLGDHPAVIKWMARAGRLLQRGQA